MSDSEHPVFPDRSAQPRLSSYEEECSRYSVDVPPIFNPVIEVVEKWADESPDDMALVSLDGTGELIAEHTASDLAELASRAAGALSASGITKGDRVLIMLPRNPAWYAAMLGAIRIGAVVMPAPNLLTPNDIAYRVQSGEASAVITDFAGGGKVDSIEEDLRTLRLRFMAGGAASGEWLDFDSLIDQADGGELPPEPTKRSDPMMLFFTSGTVGLPKMVLHPASYGLGHVSTARFWQDLRPGDRHWTVSDTGWAKAAWGGLFGQWHERATVVQVALTTPTADSILSIIEKGSITSFCAPPTLYRTLVQGPITDFDLSRLRHCTSAGEPLNPEIIRAWKEGTGGLTVLDGYGQSETTCVVANYRSVPVRAGSMGKPVPGWQVDVLDDDDKPAANDVVGNIAIRFEPSRPIGLFREYVGDDAANQKAFRNGWYFTGDKAWRDADGYFWFEGRDDDVITSSAYRIGPFEVESALINHPAVVEAAVVGKDDPERTQIVTAFCVLAPRVDASDDLASELQDHVKGQTAPYKYPREIHFVEDLPKTVSGKIRRTELRERLRNG
ncbi:MAG: AMP-binding protein [Thermoleophilia bacterium]|nr:AMP-binding protein [Thermoleophilia bacterium]